MSSGSSEFLSACDLRVLDDSGARPRVYLLEPLHYRSAELGCVITIPAGAESDFATVPSKLSGTFGITPTTGLRAAIVHDWLLKGTLPRRTADEVFREALGACGVGPHVADIMTLAVSAYTQLVTRPTPGDDQHGGVA